MILRIITPRELSLIVIAICSVVASHITEEDLSETDPFMTLELYDQQLKETFGELNLGEQYFEGDIILTENQRHVVQALWRNEKVQNRDLMLKGFRELWPNNTVPYTTAKGLRDMSLLNIHSAIQEWQSKICVTFKERQFEEDYIEFTYDGGCSANLGRIGGRQLISVGSSGTTYTDISCRSSTPYGSNVTVTCTKGNILHEIGHALGLFHEHSRPDRDQYVTVVWDNVMPGCRVHFRKENFATFDVDGKYDYNSVMHYGAFFFARERGLRTLQPNIKNVPIGQREKLSASDVRKGRLLYQCM